MKKFLLLFSALFIGLNTYAQLNMDLAGQLTYQQRLNDIWGWQNPTDSVEYALVGTTSGLSIVSLADPSQPEEVIFIPGPNSTWRDIKTWGNHAYVTNETSNGVLVVDLSQLPDEAPHFDWTPDIPELGGKISSCHNLFIDEFGTCYLAGCNLNNGGVIYVDVATEPGQPTVSGWGPNIYSHDAYARDNKLYSSEIYVGNFTIYDVTDKQDPVFLAAHNTPFNFTHNTWLSDDSKVLFTTDERADAPVGAYDISDLDDIKKLDEFRPIATIGKSVIPHNVHVWNDWLIISYYTDGGIIVDASHPENLIEVGNFDTFFGVDGGFSGAWGAYPYLPSGLVLVSDINNGLYVLEPEYVRACWLEGKVTEEGSDTPLSGVSITIDSNQPNLSSTDASGQYATGQAIPGDFEVTFEKPGYESKTISTSLENGVVTTLDATLKPLATFTLSGAVIDAADATPVSAAHVLVFNDEYQFETTTDSNGAFVLAETYEGEYNVIAGKWGYYYNTADVEVEAAPISITIELEQGYQDDFLFDYNWQSTSDSNATTGFWERGEPIGTFSQGVAVNPDSDVDHDLGDQCYVTGNGGGNAGSDDVDDGTVTLVSPQMDLTIYNAPILSFYYWFMNLGGNGTPNDQLDIRLSNGIEEVLLDTIVTSLSSWELAEYDLKDFIAITDSMRIIFETTDLPESGHLLEAGIDAFLVSEGMRVNTVENIWNPEISVSPNPSAQTFTVTVANELSSDINYEVSNQFGQVIESGKFVTSAGNAQLRLGAEWQKGFYLLKLLNKAHEMQTVKLIKH